MIYLVAGYLAFGVLWALLHWPWGRTIYSKRFGGGEGRLGTTCLAFLWIVAWPLAWLSSSYKPDSLFTLPADPPEPEAEPPTPRLGPPLGQ